MTQKDKELLLKDLCSRLLYGVILKTDNVFPQKLEGISFDKDTFVVWVSDGGFTLDYMDCKPYLFPFSSMTEEQWNNAPRVNLTNFTFESLKCGCFTIASYTCENDLHDLITFVNWLIKNHFDVNNLIPMGLAIDATGLNIY